MTLEEVIKVLETMPKANRAFDFEDFASQHGWEAACGFNLETGEIEEE